MKKIDIICNTSPIIGLISIDRLYLLWDLFGSIIIPEAVFNELCADSVNHQDEIKRIKECVNSGKIIIYKVKNADTVKALYGRLHFGELEVIVGAKELGIDFAIIDEHAARKTINKKEMIDRIFLFIKWYPFFVNSNDYEINREEGSGLPLYCSSVSAIIGLISSLRDGLNLPSLSISISCL